MSHSTCLQAILELYIASEMTPRLTIRLMTEADLPGADSLRRSVGWNQTPADWARMLRLEPDGCFVAVLGNVIVGSVTTTTYGRALGWIGMMLVHPDHRRQGIGRGLMQEALRSLRTKQIQCVKLDATPAGLPLYQQLGFVSEWTLTRHERSAGSAALPGDVARDETRELTDSDWAVVTEIDRGSFGAPRCELLRSLARDSRKALVWPAKGAVLGWGLLRPGTRADYLGPLACSSDGGSASLVTALVAGAEQSPVFWDIPDENEAAQETARRLGFAPVRPLTRMRLGPETFPSAPSAQFAIADPAVG